MNKIIEIVKKKPVFFLLVSLGYLVLTGFLKWGFSPPTVAVWYLVGGLLGIYFLDFAESFFQLTPSPFRTIVFAAAYVIVSLFVVTSSGSLISMGLVLSLYLILILWQIGEWQIKGNLDEWYRMINGPVTPRTQRWVLIVFIALFLFETYLFVR